MIHEHALRKVEFCIHEFCLDPNPKAMLDNILIAANRGYSLGTYAIRGSFVIAPVEDKDSSALLAGPEFLWPFVAESNARHFLAYLRNYFDIRGTRAEIFGIEGFVLRA